MALVYNFGGLQVGPVYDLSNIFLVNGQWSYVDSLGGLSRFQSPSGLALADLLQGVVYNVPASTPAQQPWEFGGIQPDNSATAGPQVISGEYPYTTTMPNSNKPVATHIYNSNNQFMFKIARIESDNVIWVEDPFQLAAGYVNEVLYGASENLNAMTKVVIRANGAFGIALPGQQRADVGAQTITLNANTNGIVEPFMIYSNDGDITITITQ